MLFLLNNIFLKLYRYKNSYVIAKLISSPFRLCNSNLLKKVIIFYCVGIV